MVLLKVGIVLGIIIFLLRLRLSIGVAMLAGVVALGAGFASGPAVFGRAVRDSALDPRTFDLMAVVALVMVLSHLLLTSGQFQRMMDALGDLVRSGRVRLACMPALIGLLPMPGGARFSAPMVEAAGAGMNLNPHRLSLINYWYRHIWEYSWPLYPGILLASESLGKGGIWQLSLAQLPLTATAVLAGVLFVLPRNVGRSPAPAASRKAAIGMLAANAAPIFTVVLLFGTLNLAVNALGWTGAGRPLWLPKNAPMIIGLLTACGLVMATNRMGAEPLIQYVVRKPDMAKMLGMVLSVLLFSGVFNRLGVSDALGESFRATGIPPVLIVAALPFSVGLLTSVTYVYVALTFPLIVQLVPPDGSVLPYIVLGFCFGFLGCLLSPLHLCLLLTKEYFQADFKPIYRDLIAPTLMVAAAGVGLFLLLQ